MPITRELTTEELQHLQSQGVDTAPYIGKKVTLLSDDEETPGAEVAQGSKKIGTLETIGRDLKATAGGKIAGGAGAIGTGALLTALGVSNPLIGIPLTILGAMGAGGLGQEAQNQIQGEATTEQLNRELQEAYEQNPWTVRATDVIGAALPSGGALRPGNIPKAIRGLIGKEALSAADAAALSQVGEEALSPAGIKALASNRANTQALREVALNAGINPAINIGINYARTGQLPSGADLLTDVAGGALFSGQARWAGRLTGHPINAEPTKDTSVWPEGKVGDTTGIHPDLTPDKKPLGPYMAKEGESYLIDDETLKSRFKQANPKPEEVAGQSAADYDTKLAAWKRLMESAPDAQRQLLHEAWLKEQEKPAQPVDPIKEAADRETFRNNQIDENVKRAQQMREAQQAEEDAKHQSMLNAEKNKTGQIEDELNNVKLQMLQKEKVRLEVEEENRSIEEAAKQEEAKRLAEEKAKQDALDLAGKEAFEKSLVRPNGAVDSTKAELEMRGGEVNYAKPATGKLFDVNSKASGETTVGAEFDKIRANKNSVYAPIIEAMRSDADTLKVPILFDKAFKNDITGPEAMYSDRHDKIFMHPYRYTEQVVVHEAIHAATVKKMAALGAEHPLVKELNDCYQESLKHLNPESYGAKNVNEFVSEAMTDREFQRQLNNIKTGRQSIWSRLVDAVRRLLGVDVKHGSMLERVLKPTEELISMERPTRQINESTTPEIHNAPPHWTPGSPKEKATGGKLGEFFERTIDKIARIEHPLARPFAQAAQRMLNERQNLVGEWLHPILREAKDLSSAQQANLEKAARWMLENKADPRYMLKTVEEKRVFTEVLKSLEKNFNYRFTNKEPVIRGGKPTMPQRDQFYFPTTPNPKVIEAYKNNDQAAMGKFDKLFLDYQQKLGASASDAQENLKNFREAIQGNVWTTAGVGQTQNFGAARKAQGLPLPPEMTRPGFLKNLEAYFHRMATDNSYYKNIESNDSLMQSLGSTANPWGKKLTPDANSIAGAEPVQAFLKNIRTESGSSGYHAERSLSSLATAMFLGPRTEMHKIISNFVGVANHLDNPYQVTRFLAGAIQNRVEGLAHAEKNGVIRMQSSRLSDLLSSDISAADKLRTIGQAVRKVYTLNGLTDELGTSLMQAGFESVLPDKLAKANAGDVRNRELFERLDPDYVPGKSYTPEEMTKIATNMINHIQGTGDARTMPPWMLRDTELQGFFRLAHWSIAQTNNFFSDVYKPWTRGDYQPAIKAVFGAAVGGTIIKELAELIKGKKDQIPSLREINATKGGLPAHPKALMYNMMAAATYAGFGGMLSGLVKAPIDWLNSNQAQGMSFPLDEFASEMAEMAKDVAGAIAKDPNLNWGRLAQEVSIKMLNSNFQLGRIAYTQAINAGIVTGTPAERKMLADKLGDLRRFNMIEGNPINDEAGAGNPFMNLEQKSFKLETDPQKAMAQIPGMINNIMERWYDKPDIMRQKLEALKQNQYSTFPSFEKLPLQFIEYLGYVTRLKGEAAAQEELQNYMQHHMINRMKSAVIP